MAYLLSREALDALCAVLLGELMIPVGINGEARLMVAELPGRCVVSAARVDGVLWLVLDLDKAAARRQLCALLHEWRLEWDVKPVAWPSIPAPRPWRTAASVARLSLVG